MTGYVTKTPPIKLLLTESNFNNLAQLLANTEKSENIALSEEAKKLKNKILKYSVIHTDEENNVTIDVRLFISEASELIMQLANNSCINSENDYVEILKENKKYKK